MPKKRTWVNWATVEELSLIWNVSKRRTQQIIAEYKNNLEVITAVMVEWSLSNPNAKPIYYYRGNNND